MSRDIFLTSIQPDREQPRKRFDEEKLRELAASMRENGLSTPILLRPTGDGFTIVHGERRYRAAQLLGWRTIPAEIREMTEAQARVLSLVENIQRADLTPIEEARAYRRMLDTGMTQADLGQKIGKSQSYIATKLRMLAMPECLQALLDAGLVSEGHIKQILRLRKLCGDAQRIVPGGDGRVDDFDDHITVLAHLITARHPDRWPLLPGAGEFCTAPSPARAEVARIVRDYYRPSDDGGALIFWHEVALWHAVATVAAALSVAQLGALVDQYAELTGSAP